LSISSMHATPLSARTRAPASRLMPPPRSRRTAAVKPAAVVPLPLVYKLVVQCGSRIEAVGFWLCLGLR
jgi:hypothetical protein